MTILDNSKILMYDIFYNLVKNDTAHVAIFCTQTLTAFFLGLKRTIFTETLKP